MNGMEITANRELDAESKMVVMAVGIIFDRVMRLDEKDREDLFQLTKALRTAKTEEEWVAAQRAMLEILDQNQMPARALPLENEARSSNLQKWVEFVSNKIRLLRKERGLTQDQLAEKAGLPQSHVSRIENGKHSPSHVTIGKIARALAVEPGEIDPSS